MIKKIAVIMGSDNDFPIVKSALTVLKKYNIKFKCSVMSAHRTPNEILEFSSNAKSNGFGVIICAAGMSAHLAGIVASYTTLPVIGVPIKSKFLDGIDALLSTIMMPTGVPVATVGINNAKNAAILAVQILAISNDELAKKLIDEKKKMADSVIEKDTALQNIIANT